MNIVKFTIISLTSVSEGNESFQSWFAFLLYVFKIDFFVMEWTIQNIPSFSKFGHRKPRNFWCSDVHNSTQQKIWCIQRFLKNLIENNVVRGFIRLSNCPRELLQFIAIIISKPLILCVCMCHVIGPKPTKN